MIAFQATKRGLTDRETTMEDTHVWLIGADGTNRRELGSASTTGRARRSGRRTAARCCSPCRSAGASHLYRQPVAGGKAEVVVGERGTVGELLDGEDRRSPTRSRRRPIRRSCTSPAAR